MPKERSVACWKDRGDIVTDRDEILEYYVFFFFFFFIYISRVWTVEILDQYVNMWFEVLSMFFFFMAFSWLELHKVNVTAMCGSANVCVCVCSVCVCMCAFCCRVQSCSKCPSVEFTIHLSPLTHAHVHHHTHKNRQLHLWPYPHIHIGTCRMYM